MADSFQIPYSALLEDKGNCVYGSDTFKLSVEEIIVGPMPNLSKSYEKLTRETAEKMSEGQACEKKTAGHRQPDEKTGQ